MNEWEIKYVYNGNHTDHVMADSLEQALQIWRDDHNHIPSIALDSIRCIK